jgi:hypothetical protein
MDVSTPKRQNKNGELRNDRVKITSVAQSCVIVRHIFHTNGLWPVRLTPRYDIRGRRGGNDELLHLKGRRGGLMSNKTLASIIFIGSTDD